MCSQLQLNEQEKFQNANVHDKWYKIDISLIPTEFSNFSVVFMMK